MGPESGLSVGSGTSDVVITVVLELDVGGEVVDVVVVVVVDVVELVDVGLVWDARDRAGAANVRYCQGAMLVPWVEGSAHRVRRTV